MAGRLFTSESVTEGHPDKIADRISDSVLDHLMAADPDKANLRVAGEVRTGAYAPVADIVRKAILDIGYDSSEKGFDGHTCGVDLSPNMAWIAVGSTRGFEALTPMTRIIFCNPADMASPFASSWATAPWG